MAQSYPNKKFYNSITPSVLECCVYFLSALIVLIAFNFKQFWQIWSGGITIDPHAVSPSLNGFLTGVDKVQSSPLLGDLFVVLFWAALGSVLYMIIWFTQNSLIEVKHEVIGKHISGDMVKRNYLKSLGAHYLFFLTLLVVTKASLYLVFFILLPALNKIFYSSVVNSTGTNLSNVMWGLASVLILSVVLYMLHLLLQVYTRFWRMYIKAQ